MGNMISFQDFQKLELKVAKILEAEKVEGADKLVRLKIDVGGDVRQLVAGIAKQYEPEALVGKEIVIVANLEPREIRGFTSQGMLLAAIDSDGNPVLVMPEKEVPPGSQVR